jgi:predicted transcriptional regulator
MRTPKVPDVSRRERQALDAVYRSGAATASDVQAAIPNPPSYSAVRAMLAALVRKGHLRVEHEGTRYVYHPTLALEKARTRALSHVIDTFFSGSLAQAVSAMLDERSARLSDEDARQLERLLRQSREAGR